jgi:maltose alpha-D-glucosyltransferase/alpha-amylase
VLAFVREHPSPANSQEAADRILCVNNLSRFPQPVELDLRRFEGYTPVELTGRVEFPQIGVLPYMLTLAGHGFYWFELARPVEPQPDEHEERAGASLADSLLAAGVVGDGGSDDAPTSPGGPR